MPLTEDKIELYPCRYIKHEENKNLHVLVTII